MHIKQLVISSSILALAVSVQGLRPAFKRIEKDNLVAEEPIVQASNAMAAKVALKVPPRVHLGEYEAIEGIVLARDDFQCNAAKSFNVEDSAYYAAVDASHRKLLQSALNQGVEVFYQVQSGSEQACLNRVIAWMRQDTKLDEKQIKARVHVNLNFATFSSPNIWVRDHGPIWVQSSGSGKSINNTVVQTKYWGAFTSKAQTVPNYINAPSTVSSKGGPFKPSPLEVRQFTLEGGNFMTNSEGLCISTATFLTQNTINEATAETYFSTAFGCKVSVFLEFLPFDGTKHIDMYVSFAKAKTILFGMYKDSQHVPSAEVTRANKAKLDKALIDNELKGYRIVEVPMPDPCDSFKSVSGKACAGVETICPLNPQCSLTSLSKCSSSAVFDHTDCLYYNYVPGRTYLNFFHLNNELHVPVFPKDKKFEAAALKIIAKETGKKIVKHHGEVLAYQSGSVHCITKQIPRLSLFMPR